jgi:hypothetical protein
MKNKLGKQSGGQSALGLFLLSLSLSLFCPVLLAQRVRSESLSLESGQGAYRSFDDELNQELNRVYSEPTRSQGQVQQNFGNQSQGTLRSSASPPNNSQFRNQVQTEPPTIVQASPMVESRAEALRRSRQEAEISTEQKIVEKLEQSRLEDERRRAEQLFGDRFSSLSQQAGYQTVQNPVVQNPVVVVPPPQAPVQDQVVDRELIRAEIRATLEDEKPQTPVHQRTSFSRLFLGVPDYPDARNVRGSYSLGISIGQEVRELIDFEGTFLFCQFDIEQLGGGLICDPFGCVQYPRVTQMNQYQLGAGLRYRFLPLSLIRPYFGGNLSYNYRTYTDVQFGFPNNDAQSHAVDFGVQFGADLEITNDFAIGLDLRYAWNIFNRRNNNNLQRSFVGYNPNSNPIETLSYLNVGISTKFTF